MNVCKTYYHEEGFEARKKMFTRILADGYTNKYLLAYAATVNGVKNVYVFCTSNAEELAGCTYNTIDNFGEAIVKVGITRRFFKSQRARFCYVCTMQELEEARQYIQERDSAIYNMGHALEFKLHELLKIDWSINCIPYTQGADLSYKGLYYQIKSYNGTFKVIE